MVPSPSDGDSAENEALADLRRRLLELPVDADVRRDLLALIAAGELRFRQVIESSPLGIHMYEVNRSGDLVFTGANPAANRILGVDHAQFVGMLLEEAFPSLTGTEIPARYLEIAVNGGQWNWEQVDYRDQRVAGAFEVHAFQASEGVLVVFFRDIANRLRAKKSLEASEKRFRTIFERSPVGIALIQASTGSIAQANPRLGAILGTTSEELVQRRIEDITQPEDFVREQPLVAKVIAGDEASYTVEKRFVHRDGSHVWTRMTATLVPAGLQDEQYVLGIIEDITEERRAAADRRRLELRMQQAQKLESLGVLAGGIAHDFNNLLMTILGNADLALKEVSSANPVRESLQDIITGAHRAADLCRQLLAYSGKGRFVVRNLDVNAILAEMTHLLEVSISKRTVLRLDPGERLPTIRADATQLRQVVLNLITNASEALGDDGGVVRISTFARECDAEFLRDFAVDDPLEPGLYVCIEVTDSGAGMDEEIRRCIFDPFFTTKFMGRGLGLAAVLGIVRGHRGGITVTGEPGRGTTFRVLLPASDRPADATDEGLPVVARWQAEGTVLVVDDESMVRTLARRMLQRMGFDVITAGDGASALDLFRRESARIRCVLLDLTMPQMDGAEIFRELRRIAPGVQVVLSSGYNEQDVVQRFIGQGIAGFIQKPYRIDALAATLREILD